MRDSRFHLYFCFFIPPHGAVYVYLQSFYATIWASLFLPIFSAVSTPPLMSVYFYPSCPHPFYATIWGSLFYPPSLKPFYATIWGSVYCPYFQQPFYTTASGSLFVLTFPRNRQYTTILDSLFSLFPSTPARKCTKFAEHKQAVLH